VLACSLARRNVRGELAHVGMRVGDGEHALHADRADEHARLAALASVLALLPTQPSERTMHDGDVPIDHGVRDGDPGTDGATSTRGVQSSCCVVMSRRSARVPQPAAARRPECPSLDHHGMASNVNITATILKK